jgi:hypothetical protein
MGLVMLPGAHVRTSESVREQGKPVLRQENRIVRAGNLSIDESPGLDVRGVGHGVPIIMKRPSLLYSRVSAHAVSPLRDERR